VPFLERRSDRCRERSCGPCKLSIVSCEIGWERFALDHGECRFDSAVTPEERRELLDLAVED